MQNRVLVQSLILLVIIYLTLAVQVSPESTRKVIRSTPNLKSTQIARTRRATTPKTGFFRTLFSVVYEQYADTRATIANVTKSINDNFLPEDDADQPTSVLDANATSTEDNRITRTEFNKIILRNLRGLQRLFRIELKDALKQSEVNYDEFRKNVSREVGKFL